MGKLVVVAGAQYGSEGKGAVAGYLSRTEPSKLLAIRVGGSNAGHTVVDSTGRVWRLRMVPVAAVTRRDSLLAIGQQSVLDWQVLYREITELEKAGFNVQSRLWVDSEATMQETIDVERETALTERIGSTGKGIGSARSRRIFREAKVFGRGSDTAAIARDHLREGGTVLLEGTQGFGLGLHSGFYPFTTSADCRAIDIMAQAGVSPWSAYIDSLEIWLVARVYPIRVGGNSGPLRDETSWADLGLPEEHTTVTNRVRRVGLWDGRLVTTAVEANGGQPRVRLAITMLDHLYPDLRDVRTPRSIEKHSQAAEWLRIRRDESRAAIRLIGVGPNSILEYEV